MQCERACVQCERACVCVCVLERVCVCADVFARACVRERARACVRACVRAWTNVFGVPGSGTVGTHVTFGQTLERI